MALRVPNGPGSRCRPCHAPPERIVTLPALSSKRGRPGDPGHHALEPAVGDATEGHGVGEVPAPAVHRLGGRGPPAIPAATVLADERGLRRHSYRWGCRGLPSSRLSSVPVRRSASGETFGGPPAVRTCGTPAPSHRPAHKANWHCLRCEFFILMGTGVSGGSARGSTCPKGTGTCVRYCP